MLQIVDHLVLDLEPASQTALAAARLGPRTAAQHEACCALVPAIDQLQPVAPSVAPAAFQRLRVAAWNAERCLFLAPSRDLLDRVDADVVLLTEVDHGMARAGNLHTVAELAAPTGAGFVYGVEFVETGRGSAREAQLHPDLENSASFHGNAILSRCPLADAFMVRLDDGGVWYQGPAGASELRLGGRMAIVARLAATPQPVWVASVHLESSTDAVDRAGQVERLLDAIADRVGDAAIILGGDFNTNTLRSSDGTVSSLMPDVGDHEPMFAILAKAGFRWQSINTDETTQRTRPGEEPKPTFARLDWLFARGLDGSEPETVAAVDARGLAISDHELVVATFDFPG